MNNPIGNRNGNPNEPSGFSVGFQNRVFSKPKHNPAETHSGEALQTPHEKLEARAKALHQEKSCLRSVRHEVKTSPAAGLSS